MPHLAELDSNERNTMRVGTSPARMGTDQSIEDFIAEAKEIEGFGFDTLWLPEVFGPDPFILHAAIARETRTIDLGTSVAVAHLRHPAAAAKQAATISAAAGRRFKLGVGPSHEPVIELMYGLSYARPAARMREYARVLRDFADTSTSSFSGEMYQSNITLDISNGGFDIYMAALAPRMLAAAGELADGVILWLSAPKHIEDTIVPHLTEAAEAADRARPRIVAGFPVCVTDDADGAREKAAANFAMYGQLPNYKRTFDAAGVDGPEAVSLIGDEAEIRTRVDELGALGVDELWAVPFPYGDDRQASLKRTRTALAGMSTTT